MKKTKSITEVARMGGKAILKQRGPDYFSKLVQKRWAKAKREKKAAKKS